MSSIRHGQTFKPGDSITFKGYVIDRAPLETVSCQIAVGLGTKWDLNHSIKYYLGIIPADLVFHSDGKRYCSFNETFTVPNVSFVEKNEFKAIVYAIYGVSSDNNAPNFWNYGSFWEHIYINDVVTTKPEVVIELEDHHDFCSGPHGRVMVHHAKPNAKPCTFTSSPSNRDWNNLDITTSNFGSGIVRFSLPNPDFNRDGRLTLGVSCVDNSGNTGSASVAVFKQNCFCGLKPPYSEWHPGDTENLLNSMDSIYSAVDTNRQCEYKCQNGYVWNGRACVIMNEGVCGTAAKTYTSTQTAYTGTFCSTGTASPASPVFPAPGAITSWQCLGQNGGTPAPCSATRQAIVVPPPPPPLTLIFQATPPSVPYNGASTLSWTSTNTTSCTAPNAWLPSDTPPTSKSLNGNQSTGNLTSDKTYTLTCTGAGGSTITKWVTVTVGSQPALTLKDTNCSSGQVIPASLDIKTSRTIVVCDQTNTLAVPGSWNITPASQMAFYVSGSDTATSREFTARGNDGDTIKIRATGAGYTYSQEVTLIVDKPVFKPPTPTTEREQWKEVAP